MKIGRLSLVVAVMAAALGFSSAEAAKPRACVPNQTNARLLKAQTADASRRVDGLTAVLAESGTFKPQRPPGFQIACRMTGASAGLSLLGETSLRLDLMTTTEPLIDEALRDGRGLCALHDGDASPAQIRRDCFVIGAVSALAPVRSVASRMSALRAASTPLSDDVAADLTKRMEAASNVVRASWELLTKKGGAAPDPGAVALLEARKPAICDVATGYARLQATVTGVRASDAVVTLNRTQNALLADAAEALYPDKIPAICAAGASVDECRDARKAQMLGVCAGASP